MPGISPLSVRDDRAHAYHLYVVKLDLERLSADRDQIFRALRAEGIGVNVHYIPVHLHPFYRSSYGTGYGMCPVAERVYREIISLPLHPRMTEENIQEVVEAVSRVIRHYR